jgi:hypothetical protein
MPLVVDNPKDQVLEQVRALNRIADALELLAVVLVDQHYEGGSLVGLVETFKAMEFRGFIDRGQYH